MGDLEERFQEVDQIGPARAETLAEIARDELGDGGDYQQACRDALDKLEEGHASHAEGHLRQALEE